MPVNISILSQPQLTVSPLDQWIAFASKPLQDPTDRDGLMWPKYSPEGDTMLLFGNETGPVQLVPGNAGGYDCE